jgi:predicted aspartyl protease
LPPAQIAALGLKWQGIGRGTLADGSECLFDVFEAEVLWDGLVRRVPIDEADTDPLLGMTLLDGYELKIEVRTGGKVEIEAL